MKKQKKTTPVETVVEVGDFIPNVTFAELQWVTTLTDTKEDSSTATQKQHYIKEGWTTTEDNASTIQKGC